MFALVSQPELAILSGLTKSQILVYLSLSSHCRDGSTCFPSIKRISHMLGNSLHERTIFKALKALEAVGLLVRKHKSSINRFRLKVRERFMLLRGKKSDDRAERAHRTWPRGHYKKRKVKESSYNREKQESEPFIWTEERLDALREVKNQRRAHLRRLCIGETRQPSQQFKESIPEIKQLFGIDDWKWLKSFNPVLLTLLKT